MGITGELVRSVFSKSHSIPRHEKRKWSSSVRSYLCGDEHSSLLAADDSTSVTVATEAEFASFRSNVATDKSTGTRDASAEEDSSEATVDQPSPAEPNSRDEKRNSTYKLFRQEDAALIIQSAFRNFMARRARDEEKPARDESIGTSVEVQTGHSYSSDDVRRAIRRRTGAQVLKIQEDWDDSTVSSVISKMRMQNRLEAATRRERALAYAFSQQLRICSKKQSSGGGGDEANMGWSWLERWMAARQPEMNKLMGAMEEKESCGSNEVSSLVEFSNLPISLPKNIPKPTNKARTLAKRSFSRQSSTSSHLSPKESKDVKKVMWHVEEEKEKRKRQKQPGFNKRDAKNATALEVA
ncbi:protein IQ-DOMAIN 33-like [Salvia miltiorrhiza]|uniref:protein IQ-DOMAIN 33-like n=1 Tax=Salvia miltiorrhiza TaxID=226208 RepID=UPI0025ABD735|nr:protein IQ-DOMAIN 33-like [Salvia miltiorrhiza]